MKNNILPISHIINILILTYLLSNKYDQILNEQVLTIKLKKPHYSRLE